MNPWRTGVYIPQLSHRYLLGGRHLAGAGSPYGRYPFGAYAEVGRSSALLPHFPGYNMVVQPGSSMLQPGLPLDGQPLTRREPCVTDPAVVPPSSIRPTDRTVQIDGFTWVLPPDPGPGGGYPKLEFLVGAAISSAKGGKMTLAKICQWIRARYPGKPKSADSSVKSVLTKKGIFKNTRTGKHGRIGEWVLCDPKLFRQRYEANIFRHRCTTASRDGACTDALLSSSAELADPESASSEALLSDQPVASSTGAETSPVSEPLVTIGGRSFRLPPVSANQKRPPLKLLCGCAIALGPEQGVSSDRIVDWIVKRYSIQGEMVVDKLHRATRAVLSMYKSDFRRVESCASPPPETGRPAGRWHLKNPADFAGYYREHQCRWLINKADQAPSSDQPLARKRPNQADPAEEFPAKKKPDDRTVQIAGFTWTLPPDPGRGERYPNLSFLIGCAISSSECGAMETADIVQWIAARYPSKAGPLANTIRHTLTVQPDFINTRGNIYRRAGAWKLRSPDKMRKAFEKNIFCNRVGLPRRIHRQHALLSSEQLTSEWHSSQQGGDTPTVAAAPAVDRTAQIGGYTYTLPPDRGWLYNRHPSLIFLIGCAISSSEGETMEMADIIQWIKARYPSMPESAGLSIRFLLINQIHFASIKACQSDRREWQIRNADALRSYCTNDILWIEQLAKLEPLSLSPGSVTDQKGATV